MKVVLLAGGVSKRLWPLTIDKNLWPFYPESLLSYNLKTLKGVGLTEIILVVNPGSEKPAKKISADLNIPIEVVIQPEANGIGRGLLLAEEKIKGQSLLVLNCDDIVAASLLTEVIKKAATSKAEIILAGKKVGRYFDGGYFKLAGEKAVGMVEKPGDGKEPSDLVKLVVDYYLDANHLLSALKEVQTAKDDHYETALDKLLQEKDNEVISYAGDWLTVKYPWQLLAVCQFFLRNIKEQQIDSSAVVSPRAVIEGPVIIEAGVKILENAKVKGPVYLGKNVVIANNTLVRDAYIGAGSVVGFGTEVARSYIGEDCWTHSNFIGDSILQKNVSFGYGTVLANLKLDESEIYSSIKGNKINSQQVKLGAVIGENVRIGANSTIMPGVKIGKNSLIGASVMVKEDLTDGQYLYVNQNLVKKVNRRSLSSNNKADIQPDRSSFKGKI